MKCHLRRFSNCRGRSWRIASQALLVLCLSSVEHSPIPRRGRALSRRAVGSVTPVERHRPALLPSECRAGDWIQLHPPPSVITNTLLDRQTDRPVSTPFKLPHSGARRGGIDGYGRCRPRFVDARSSSDTCIHRQFRLCCSGSCRRIGNVGIGPRRTGVVLRNVNTRRQDCSYGRRGVPRDADHSISCAESVARVRRAVGGMVACATAAPDPTVLADHIGAADDLGSGPVCSSRSA
ncbi:hypothetical protein M2284_000308 [Rhodococcus sp. LBL1]|nr:hypothetical protein [Rhodococcus sp. LBL1]MDH6681406.1 hypothetical protein [Rhodococcus sp. LBL2]